MCSNVIINDIIISYSKCNCLALEYINQVIHFPNTVFLNTCSTVEEVCKILSKIHESYHEFLLTPQLFVISGDQVMIILDLK